MKPAGEELGALGAWRRAGGILSATNKAAREKRGESEGHFIAYNVADTPLRTGRRKVSAVQRSSAAAEAAAAFAQTPSH